MYSYTNTTTTTTHDIQSRTTNTLTARDHLPTQYTVKQVESECDFNAETPPPSAPPPSSYSRIKIHQHHLLFQSKDTVLILPFCPSHTSKNHRTKRWGPLSTTRSGPHFRRLQLIASKKNPSIKPICISSYAFDFHFLSKSSINLFVVDLSLYPYLSLIIIIPQNL